MEKSATGSRRLLELDSLRGLAALAVVLYHYTVMYPKFFGPAQAPLFTVSKGYLGVKLFFIISGFVILMTVTKAKSALDFMVSRFSRIYPAYWGAIVITFGLLTVTGLWPDGAVSRSAALVNLTMLQEFAHIKDVDGVYWTLQYELVFYGLALALLMFGLVKRVEWVSAGLLAATVGYWLALRHDLFATYGHLGALVKWGLLLLIVFQNVQFFVTGMMLYRIWKDGFSILRGLVLAASVATTFVTMNRFNGEIHVAFALAMAAAASGKVGLLRSGPLVFLGTISYTLYLTHQNAGYVMLHELQKRGFNMTLSIGVTILTALALAALLSACVEQPAMHAIRAAYNAFKNRGRKTVNAPAALPAD